MDQYVGLPQKIWQIIDENRVNKKDVILDELWMFMITHENHGGFELKISHGTSELERIALTCKADSGLDRENCDHYDRMTGKKVGSSIVYSKKNGAIIRQQADERQEYHNRILLEPVDMEYLAQMPSLMHFIQKVEGNVPRDFSYRFKAMNGMAYSLYRKAEAMLMQGKKFNDDPLIPNGFSMPEFEAMGKYLRSKHLVED